MLGMKQAPNKVYGIFDRQTGERLQVGNGRFVWMNKNGASNALANHLTRYKISYDRRYAESFEIPAKNGWIVYKDGYSYIWFNEQLNKIEHDEVNKWIRENIFEIREVDL